MTLPLLALALLTGPPAQAAGDRDNWTVAKHVAAEFGVSPVLMIGIRYHENPKRHNDYKALGVKRGHGWWPGGMSGQYHKAAQIVARYAKRHGWDPRKPTRQQVSDLGAFYAEGSRHWGREVWSFYRRMHTKRAEVAR